ncbi:hypothetical protein [Chryseobacterium arthrosphaerae]|nr:hypothetical protein [Chryseobacterium arthrosphaerae]
MLRSTYAEIYGNNDILNAADSYKKKMHPIYHLYDPKLQTAKALSIQ